MFETLDTPAQVLVVIAVVALLWLGLGLTGFLLGLVDVARSIVRTVRGREGEP